MYSPSWSTLPPPSLPDPSGSSQCTRSEHLSHALNLGWHVLFNQRELEGKSRKSRDTWNNRQVWLWSTKWIRTKINRVLPREGTGHSKYPLPTTQETTLHMDITRWSVPRSDWLYSLQLKMDKFYIARKTRPGPDCGSDHELLIAKFRLKLKRVGKTTRPFR